MRTTNCEICSGPLGSSEWRRCKDHKKCDGCGTTTGICFHTEGVWCKACRKVHTEKLIKEARVDALDCFETDDAICPYCGETFDSGDTYEWGMSGEHTCRKCDSKFIYDVEVRREFSTYRMEEVK